MLMLLFSNSSLKEYSTARGVIDLVVLPKDLKVKYYSSDESIVVIKNGVFKAVEVGQCEITVVVEYGKLRTSGTVSVTINDYNY